MNFLTASHTDVGIRKKTNQDSMCIKVAETKFGQVCMVVVCDGMGGLQKGELASATVIRAFSRWFNEDLPRLLQVRDFGMSIIKNAWETLINKQNELVYRYGINENIQLGTTLTALLIVNDAYLTAQLGDSRAYKIDKELVQLTKDQSVVAREVSLGHITEEQAKKDSRRNVLLQCLGAAKNIRTEYTSGKIGRNTCFLLCSDGFVHELDKKEIYGLLSPNLIKNEQDIKNALTGLVDLNKKRGETDNITALCVKAV
ncbi:MAG: protein phosphatase 2C domain-containing protein [Clostridiales bacterium]|nr:protein phosphatase 2C domain-containing protein [Clostridiales bacterium]MCD7828031.1 protein phosphatase 2C domain-containing protein [Clostridiales bacterium]